MSTSSNATASNYPCLLEEFASLEVQTPTKQMGQQQGNIEDVATRK